MNSVALFSDDRDYDFGIKKTANHVEKPLCSSKFRYQRIPQPSQRNDGSPHPTCIKDEDSNVNYDHGKPWDQNCFICCKYSKKVECTWWI